MIMITSYKIGRALKTQHAYKVIFMPMNKWNDNLTLMQVIFKCPKHWHFSTAIYVVHNF